MAASQPIRAKATPRVRRAVACGALLLLGGLAGGGCVERELTIDSQPQGALVYMNGVEIGRTPLKKEFTWYGTYDVVVRKEGYQTLKTKTPVIAPAWQWVPMDLAAEFVPTRLTDTHHLSYTLTPISDQAVNADELIGRGEAFRGALESGTKPPKTQPATRPTKPGKAGRAPRTAPATRPG